MSRAVRNKRGVWHYKVLISCTYDFPVSLKYSFVDIHIHTYIHARTHTHTHTRARTHTHAHKHAHTHTHTHTQSAKKSKFFSLTAFRIPFFPFRSQACGMLHYFLQWPIITLPNSHFYFFLLRKKYAPSNATRVTVHIFCATMHTWNVQLLGSFDLNLTGRLFLSPQKFAHSTLRTI